MTSAVFSKIKRARAALNSSNPIKVTVHTTFEQHTTTETIQTDDHDSYNVANEQVHETPDGWGLDDVGHGM